MKNPAAVALGTLGGKVKSEAKAKSSAANGAKGGRPVKRAISYEAIIQDENLNEQPIPLEAHNDKFAIREMNKLVVKHEGQDVRIYCKFRKTHDDCIGYLNPDGNANASGESWL